MKQTAVQWIFEKYYNTKEEFYSHEVMEEALEMEKEQIIDAYQANSWGEPEGAEQYYKEIYETKND